MRELRKETETLYKTIPYHVLLFLNIRNERTPKGDGNKDYNDLPPIKNLKKDKK